MVWIIDNEDANNVYVRDDSTGATKAINKVTEKAIAQYALENFSKAEVPNAAPNLTIEYDENNKLTNTRNVSTGKTTPIQSRAPSPVTTPQLPPVRHFNQFEGMDKPTVEVTDETAKPQPSPAPQMKIPSVESAYASLSGLANKTVKDQNKILKVQDSAFKAQEDAAKAAEEAGKLAAQKEAAYYKELQSQQVLDKIDADNAEAARQDHLQLELNKTKRMSDEVANAKLKPFNPSAEKQIGLAISAFLIELGAGLRGAAPGQGIALINRIVEQDLEMQKAELEVKRKGLDVQLNVVALTRQLYADERQQEAAARVLKYEATINKLKRILSETKSESIAAAGKEAFAQIQTQKAQALQELIDATNNRLIQIEAHKADLAAKNAAIEAERASAKGSNEDLRVPGLQLTGERIPSSQEAKDASKARTTVLNVLDKIKAIRDHIAQYGTEYTSTLTHGLFESEAKKTGKAMARDLHLELKNVKELGVLTGDDMRLIESQAGKDPTDFWTSDYLSTLEKLEKSTLQGWARKSRQYGYVDTEIGAPSTFRSE